MYPYIPVVNLGASEAYTVLGRFRFRLLGASRMEPPHRFAYPRLIALSDLPAGSRIRPPPPLCAAQ